jgi:hypothetical protein
MKNILTRIKQLRYIPVFGDNDLLIIQDLLDNDWVILSLTTKPSTPGFTFFIVGQIV